MDNKWHKVGLNLLGNLEGGRHGLWVNGFGNGETRTETIQPKKEPKLKIFPSFRNSPNRVSKFVWIAANTSFHTKLSLIKLLYLALFLPLVFAGCMETAQSQKSSIQKPAESEDGDRILLNIAYDYLRSNIEKYGITDPDRQLSLKGIKKDTNTQHLKFVQQVNGVPIWGNELIVHIRDKEVYFAQGKIQSSLFKLSVTPQIAAKKAEQIARRHVLDDATISSTTTSQLMILPNATGSGALTYLIEINQGLKRYILFVDALNGHVIKQVDAMPSYFN